MSKGCGKGGLIPIRFSDLYLPKTTLHIKLAENHCSTKPIYKVFLVWNRVPYPF